MPTFWPPTTRFLCTRYPLAHPGMTPPYGGLHERCRRPQRPRAVRRAPPALCSSHRRCGTPCPLSGHRRPAFCVHATYLPHPGMAPPYRRPPRTHAAAPSAPALCSSHRRCGTPCPLSGHRRPAFCAYATHLPHPGRAPPYRRPPRTHAAAPSAPALGAALPALCSSHRRCGTPCPLSGQRRPAFCAHATHLPHPRTRADRHRRPRSLRFGRRVPSVSEPGRLSVERQKTDEKSIPISLVGS